MKRKYNPLTGIWVEVGNEKKPKKEEKKESNYKGIPMNYKELQELAKKLDIPANQSKEDLIKQIDDTIS